MSVVIFRRIALLIWQKLAETGRRQTSQSTFRVLCESTPNEFQKPTASLFADAERNNFAYQKV